MKRALQSMGLALVFIAVNQTSGKSVDRTPLIYYPGFWEQHAMVLVEVTGPGAGDEVPCKLIEQYSGDDWKPPVAISKKEFWIGVEGQPADGNIIEPVWKSGQHLLLTRYNLDGSRGAGIVLIEPLDKSKIVIACRAIRKLRSEKDLGVALQQAVATGDPTVELFALHSILNNAKTLQDGKLTIPLEKIRSDTGSTIQVRLMASKVRDETSTPNEKSTDWDWVAGLLAKVDQFSTRDMQDVIEQMLAHKEMRAESAALLEKIVVNPKVELSKRTLALETFSRPGLYDRSKEDDPVFASAITFLLRQLADNNTSLTRSAATTLWRCIAVQYSEQGLTEKHRATALRVSKAIDDAIAKASDLPVRNELLYCNEQLKELLTPKSK